MESSTLGTALTVDPKAAENTFCIVDNAVTVVLFDPYSVASTVTALPRPLQCADRPRPLQHCLDRYNENSTLTALPQ